MVNKFEYQPGFYNSSDLNNLPSDHPTAIKFRDAKIRLQRRREDIETRKREGESWLNVLPRQIFAHLAFSASYLALVHRHPRSDTAYKNRRRATRP